MAPLAENRLTLAHLQGFGKNIINFIRVRYGSNFRENTLFVQDRFGTEKNVCRLPAHSKTKWILVLFFVWYDVAAVSFSRRNLAPNIKKILYIALIWSFLNDQGCGGEVPFFASGSRRGRVGWGTDL